MGRSLLSWAAASVMLACSAAPRPAPEPDAPRSGARAADVVDDCAEVPGKPPPQALIKRYEGVAAKARCQREVYTIMGGLTHFLGVRCAHCHEEPDYAKMTHNKHVANWMARELIPSLQRKGGGEIWCNDCHVVEGKGTAKILGSPRDQQWTAEWMTVHLAGEMDTAEGAPLRCKSCHGANLGQPGFRKKIILTDQLPVPSERRRRPEPRGTAPAPALPAEPPPIEEESPENPPDPAAAPALP